MSVFEGLFPCDSSKESSLFKSDSKFKAELVEEPLNSRKVFEGRRSNKRDREKDDDSGGEELEGSSIVKEEGDQEPGIQTLSSRQLTKTELKGRQLLEDEKTERTIFVGNLMQKPKLQKKMKTLFSQFGQVESTRIRSTGVAEGVKLPKKAAFARGETGTQGTCNVYVVFKDKASVKPALKMNMTLYDGCHMRVDRSVPPRHKPGSSFVPVFDHKTSVFVHNLVPEVLDEELINFFYGQNAPALQDSIEAVRLIRDQRLRQCKGIGYVKFKTRKAVTEALKLNGSRFQGRKLKINSVKTSKQPRDAIVNDKVSDKQEGAARRVFEKKLNSQFQSNIKK